jgi:hypothetical protein
MGEQAQVAHIAIYPLDNGYIVCRDQWDNINKGIFVRKVGGIPRAIAKLYGLKKPTKKQEAAK